MGQCYWSTIEREIQTMSHPLRLLAKEMARMQGLSMVDDIHALKDGGSIDILVLL